MGFIILNAFLLFIAFIGLVILWWVWPPDSPWSPWWRTSGKKAQAAAKLANISSKDIVYELGSGDATFLVVAAKKFGANCVGIEIDFLRNLTAKLNVWINKVPDKIILKRKNFFEEDLSDATVVFVYLVPRVLEKLKPKLFAELKKGTRLISYKYKFEPDKKLKFIKSNSKDQIHLYKIN